MRAIAACLVGFLGLGALATMAACSDATDGSGGAAGSSGASSSAGAGGSSAAAGATSSAGSGGGSAECGFLTQACTACFSANCKDQYTECAGDTDCAQALGALPNCVCGSSDSEACQSKFVTDGGDSAEKLANCFTLNCEEECQ
jgi:hypothetical protein